MNWHKAKTILIWFFVLVNIFLLYFNVLTRSHNSRIDSEIITHTVNILKKNGITLNPDIVPKKNISILQFEADNIIEDYDSFAKAVLGENVRKLSEGAFVSEKGNLKLMGDTFIFTSSAPLPLKNFNKADALEILEDFGIVITNFEYKKLDNKIIFTNTANNFKVFNSEIILENTDENTKIYGTWFFKYDENLPSTAKLKPVTSVLIDLLSHPSKPQNETEIKSLTLGYSVYESETYHKSLVPMPVWRIELADDVLYMDARTH